MIGSVVLTTALEGPLRSCSFRAIPPARRSRGVWQTPQHGKTHAPLTPLPTPPNGRPPRSLSLSCHHFEEPAICLTAMALRSPQCQQGRQTPGTNAQSCILSFARRFCRNRSHIIFQGSVGVGGTVLSKDLHLIDLIYSRSRSITSNVEDASLVDPPQPCETIVHCVFLLWSRHSDPTCETAPPSHA